MKKTLLILIAFGILYSCTDKKEFISIYISKPQTNSDYTIFDTIHYKFTITQSNAEIKEIFVFISDQNQQVTHLEKTTHYEGAYIINETDLNTGTYYFTVQVNTLKDTYKAFKRINITGYSKQLINIVSFSDNKLTILSNNFNIKAEYELPYEILDIETSPCGYYINNNFFGTIVILFSDGSIQKFVPNDASDYSLQTIDNNVLLGISDIYNVKFYRHEGDYRYSIFAPLKNTFSKISLCSFIAMRSSTLPNNYQIPQTFFQDSNYVYVACKSTNITSNSFFYIYHLSDLSFYKSFPLNSMFQPKNILKANDNNFYLFGNINNECYYYNIYTEENTFYLNNLSSYGNLYFATTISPDNLNNGILFSTDKGLYVITTNGISQIHNISPHCYAREEISNDIFLCSGDTIYKFSPQSYLVEMLTLGYSKIKLQYNK